MMKKTGNGDGFKLGDAIDFKKLKEQLNEKEKKSKQEEEKKDK